ncbi:acetyltransferase, partial [mine drainage metagenome]
MPVEFRAIRPDELPEFATVNLTAFGEHVDPWHERWFQQRVRAEGTVAAFADGRMVGSSLALPLEIGLPGAVVSAAGVTAVGVLPTHRRRGLLREMMTRQLLAARQGGLALAVLWASEGGIYSRFGFGPAARSWRIALE